MATKPLSAEVGSLLVARQVWFNQHFRLYGRGLDPQVMYGYLREVVGPVVEQLPEEARQPVAEALFRVGLAAQRRGLLGVAGEASMFESGIRDALLLLRRQLVPLPDATMAAAANGYDRMARQTSAEAAALWLRRWSTVGASAEPVMSHEQLLALGLVLAWQHGLAEAREAAVEHALQLPPAMVVQLFGAGDLCVEDERRFASPVSGAELGEVQFRSRVGGFVGFGGPFRRPPVVRRIGQRLLATDGIDVREVFADVYGARLVAAAAVADDVLQHGVEDGANLSPQGALVWHGERRVFDTLRASSACVACRGMVAVTLRASHFVFLLGRAERSDG